MTTNETALDLHPEAPTKFRAFIRSELAQPIERRSRRSWLLALLVPGSVVLAFHAIRLMQP